MSEWVKLTAGDGNELQAYVARPEGEAIGALVVVQEIFGVNPSIQAVADSYAKDGFVAIAPALFDRLEKGVLLGYGPEDMKKAFALYPQLDVDKALLDVGAAYAYAQGTGKGVGVIGFCYGGLMAWLSATRGENVKMQPACTVGYYAGGVGKVARTRWMRCARRILMWRSICMRARGMRLRTPTVRAMWRRRRSWRGSGRWRF